MTDKTDPSRETDWKIQVLILKKIAENKGISQQEIANRTGFQRTNINRMFALAYCPNLNTFIAVAKAIGVNFFFGDKDGTTELDKIFESAMEELGRRPNKLPSN